METKHNKPSSDWRSLTIYQIMVGSFLHGEGGAEGYDSLWGRLGNVKTVICRE